MVEKINAMDRSIEFKKGLVDDLTFKTKGSRNLGQYWINHQKTNSYA